MPINNLFLASILFATSGVLVLSEVGFRHTADAENRRLSAAVREVENRLKEGASLLANAQVQLEQLRELDGNLALTLSVTAAEPAPLPMNAEGEGLWPADKPYYYFPKGLLSTVFFQQFKGSELGMRLHSHSVTVLGMTPREASIIDDGFENLIAQFKQLEVEHLIRSPVHASTNFPSDKKTSYRLPPLRTDMEPAMEEYFASTRALLGNDRTDLFEKWVRRCIAESLGDFAPKARILTLTEVNLNGDRRLTRFELAEEGERVSSYHELWDPPRDDYKFLPEAMRPRFPYRHLFGENGEKRP